MNWFKLKLHAFWAWRYRDIVLLSLMIGAVVVGNVAWAVMETRPPHWDMGRHLWNSLVYFEHFKHGELFKLIDAYYYYPPLIYWLAAPFYLLFGVSAVSAIASNSVFVIILVLSVYGIGRTLWSKETGLMAAAFVLGTPMVVSQFKEFQVDAPLTAMVTLALYLLIQSRNFLSRKYSLMFGLACGLGLLTKWTFPFIIALPVLVAVLSALIFDWKQKAITRIVNMAGSGLAAIAVAYHWYVAHRYDIQADLLKNGVAAGLAEGDPLVGTAASNFWYLFNLINSQLYLIPFLLFVIGLCWLRRNSLRKNLYPLLLIIGCLGFFTFLQNKDARYTLPIIGAVGVMAVYWLGLLPELWRKRLAIGIAAYSVLAYGVISFGPSHSFRELSFSIGPHRVVLFAPHGYIIGPPSGEEWHQEEALKFIADKAGYPRAVYFTGPESIWFNNWGMQYYASLHKLDLTSDSAQADFILAREPGPRPMELASGKFRLLATYKLPDNSTIRVYQKTD